MSFHDILDQIDKADIVITHGGNTVRLVQRKGKVPIAMAREASKGEMPNDHQVDYLRYEEQHGWVVPLWNAADLPTLVETHLATQARILATRPPPQKVSGEIIAAILNRLCEKWVR
jgi:UDP-N-acetylglucosamine transferase subunit ALG13